MAFSYNPYSNSSMLSQYQSHLQNQNYVNQIVNVIDDTAQMKARVIAFKSEEVRQTIRESSQEQSYAIMQASNAICTTLENGFSELYSGLVDVNEGIADLSNLIGHCFSLVIEGQKITNKYLKEIKKISKISDNEKQRVIHFERGINYLSYALNQSTESPKYIHALDDAIDKFKDALKVDSKDFFSLYHLGFIYLKSAKHLDPSAAEVYFRESIRHFLPEIDAGGSSVTKALLSKRDLVLEVANTYLFCAEACYLQGKFSEAVDLAKEAWTILPRLTKAGFMWAKYLSADKQVEQSVSVLEKVLEIDITLSVEVLNDFDLVSKQEIRNLLERLRLNAIREVRKNIKECTNEMLPNSFALQYLSEIDSVVRRNTLLDAKKAKDMLHSRKWTIGLSDKVNNVNWKIIDFFQKSSGKKEIENLWEGRELNKDEWGVSDASDGSRGIVFIDSVANFVKIETELNKYIKKQEEELRGGRKLHLISLIEREEVNIKNCNRKIEEYRVRVEEIKNGISKKWIIFTVCLVIALTLGFLFSLILFYVFFVIFIIIATVIFQDNQEQANLISDIKRKIDSERNYSQCLTGVIQLYKIELNNID